MAGVSDTEVVAELLSSLAQAEAEIRDGQLGPQSIAMLACVKAFRLHQQTKPDADWATFRAGYLAGMEVHGG